LREDSLRIFCAYKWLEFLEGKAGRSKDALIGNVPKEATNFMLPSWEGTPREMTSAPGLRMALGADKPGFFGWIKSFKKANSARFL